jgi:hypothetical protein
MTATARSLAFVARPATHSAPDAAGGAAAPSLRVFEEVERGGGTAAQGPGWLRRVLHAAAVPGGIPPGRTRPEPPGHSAP